MHPPPVSTPGGFIFTAYIMQYMQNSLYIASISLRFSEFQNKD